MCIATFPINAHRHSDLSLDLGAALQNGKPI